MKPPPCFEPNKQLEAAARQAEQRKNQALDRLLARLGPNGRFEQPILIFDEHLRARRVEQQAPLLERLNNFACPGIAARGHCVDRILDLAIAVCGESRHCRLQALCVCGGRHPDKQTEPDHQRPNGSAKGAHPKPRHCHRRRPCRRLGGSFQIRKDELTHHRISW